MPRPVYVIGHPIGHSLSPPIPNAALAELGIDAEDRAVDVPPDELSSWVGQLRKTDAIGFNVTVPHKERIRDLLDEIGGDAAIVGAVNTVVVNSGLRAPQNDIHLAQLSGWNTDTIGFRRTLAEEASTALTGQR